MKLRILLAVIGFTFIAIGARADQFEFQPNRVESLTVTTTKQGARIVSKVFDKSIDKETVSYKIQFKKKTDNVYVSSKGTTFTLEHVTPIHNEGHTIDSGDWKMRATGSGEEFEKVKLSANEDGDSTDKEAVFYGSKVK
jgi:hypothetical protein